jgi:hypothetical protein
MSAKLDSGVSRRRFLISTSMAATVGLLAPRDLFAQDELGHYFGMTEAQLEDV